MTKEQIAFGVSLVAMLFIASSYFVKKKSQYLLMQTLGICFLILFYLFTGEYFAMVGLIIGLARSATYLLYEIKNKAISVLWPSLFSLMGVIAYCIINLWILQTAKLVDIIYLIGLIAYAFVFWIRKLELLRYLVLIPTGISILYNVLIHAVPFVIVSYSFELTANLIAIAKYDLFQKKRISPKQENEDEKN